MNRANKKGRWILLYFLLPAGLLAGFFFSGYVHVTLIEGFRSLEQIKAGILIQSLMNNSNHLKLFLSTEAILTCMIAAYVLLWHKETFESDVDVITENIKTPVRIGQGQHGTAKWLEQRDYSHVFATATLNKKASNTEILATGGLVVGFNEERGLEEIHYLDDDVHTCVIGATRSGKTRSLVLPSVGLIALSGESMVISDPKAEITSFTIPFLENLGYEIIRLDFKNPLKSSRYNFLQPVIDAVNAGDNAKAVNATWDITASLIKLSVVVLVTGNILYSLAVVFMAMKTPKFLQEFLLVSGGSGSISNTVYHTSRLYSMTKSAIFKGKGGA